MIVRVLPGTTRDLPALTRGHGRELLTLVGLSGGHWRQWELQLRDLESKRARVAFYRIRQQLALSFHLGDTRDRPRLTAVALDTLDRLGFGGQPAVIALHTNRPHHQVRIVTTRATPAGGLVTDSLIHSRAAVVASSIEQAHGLYRTPAPPPGCARRATPAQRRGSPAVTDTGSKDSGRLVDGAAELLTTPRPRPEPEPDRSRSAA